MNTILSQSPLRGLTARAFLTAGLSLGVTAVASSAEAAEITTVTHDGVAFCVGSDIGGSISVQKMGTKTTLTDGKTTAFQSTNTEVNNGKMDNPLDSYEIERFGKYAIFKFPASNGMKEGHYFYDTETGNVALVVNKSNYPDYDESTKLHIVPGATPDKAQLVFLNLTISVYGSPFDANWKVKPECETGPVKPNYTHVNTVDASDHQAYKNAIFYLNSTKTKSGVYTGVVTKLIVGPTGITQDNSIAVEGLKVNSFPKDQFTVTCKDATGKETIYFKVKISGGTTHLFNVDDIKDHKQTNAYDIVVVDPDGRYELKVAKDGADSFPVFMTDTHANPPVTKIIIQEEISPLAGSVFYLSGLPTPAWVIYSQGNVDNYVYLVELLDTKTLETKVTKMPLEVFNKKYSGTNAGVACAALPNPKVTITKTGTVEPAPEPNPEVVEAAEAPDAESTEVDGGAEVVSPPPDAIDAWLDGKGDMQDIFKEAGGDDTAPDVLVPPPDGTQDTLDQTDASEVSGSDVDAAIDAWLDGNGDMQDIFTEEVDGVVTAPDMSTNDGVVKAEVEPDTAAPKDNGTPAATDNGAGPLDAGRNGGVDGIASNDGKNNPPVAKPPVKPSQPDCNAGPDGNPNSTFPFALAAIGLTFTRVRRRVEAVMRWLAEK